jgi:hypothetical protein
VPARIWGDAANPEASWRLLPIDTVSSLAGPATRRRTCYRARWSRPACGGVPSVTRGRRTPTCSAPCSIVVGVPFAGGGDGGGGTRTEQASPAPAEAASSQAAGLAAPLPYLRDGRLHVLDPQGVDHELGLDVEAVLGSTESATSAGSTPSTATRVREPGPGLPGRRPGAPPRWRAGGRADRHRRLPMGVDSEPRAGGRGARQRLPLALRRPGRLARTASRRCGTGTAVDALRRGRRACEVGGRPSCRRLSVEGEDLTLAR